MKYEENMSGWRNALKDENLKTHQSNNELKLTSIKRLINSGLPTYEFYFLNASEVLFGNKAKEIYDIFNETVVVRACPKIKGLQRYTLINKPLNEIQDFLKNIHDKENYTITFNEYDPALYSGVISSDKNKLIIELVKDENLENLCHGHITPHSAIFSKDVHGYRKMNYINEVPINIKKIMWNIIKLISKNNNANIPEFFPKQGYFEFVISKKYKCVKFVDYISI